MKRLILICAVVGLMLAATDATAGPIGYSVRSDIDSHLYSIDLSTGEAIDLGLVGLNDAEGIGFVGNTLYAIGGSVDEFWDITTPPGFKVGDTGDRWGHDSGLAYDVTSKKLYNINAGPPTTSGLYEIDMMTGVATEKGIYEGAFCDGLAIDNNGVAYAADFETTVSLYTVNLDNGQLTLVGDLGYSEQNNGLAFDPLTGILYALTDGTRLGCSKIFTIDTITGAATFVADVTLGGNTIEGFESLAIPEPTTIALFGLGSLILLRRKRSV